MNRQSRWDDLLSAASGDIRRLDHVVRFSSIPVSFQETTSMHSYWVGIYSAMIHREAVPDDGLFRNLLGPILLKALVHDLPECVTGDVVRVFKYSTPELKKEVDRAEEILARELPDAVTGLMKPSMVEDRHRRYVEAVVKCADFMSLSQFMIREAQRGNGQIRPFFSRMEKDLESMIQKEKNTAFPEMSPEFRLSDPYEAMLEQARREVRCAWGSR